jgi:N-acetylmuramoyl-L-alanine amidase
VIFDAATLDRIAKKRGFSVTFEGKTYHISYHYVILPDGTIQTGRPDHCQGAHCPKYNNWLGICLIGDFHDKTHWWPSTPTEAEKTSLVSLCESLMSKYHIRPENVRRHRDVRETWCPGNRFPYGEIQKQLHEYSNVHPETLTGAAALPVPTAAQKAGIKQKEE